VNEITKLFDDKCREELKLRGYLEELEYNNMAVKNMVVKQVSVKFARPFIAMYHYSKTMPDSTKFVYAGYFKDKLAGIIVFGMGAGVNQYTALVPTIQKGEYLELTRLWSPDSMPHNTESKLISESLKLLPKEYKLLVSFADPSRNHVGTIYQATNWYYCGKSNGGKMLITEDGIEKHPRLLGIYKMRHPELKNYTNKELMDLYGWKYTASSEKHRYCFLRGDKREKKEMFKYIKEKIQPYPKLNNLQIFSN
jgi:hypothetical protein